MDRQERLDLTQRVFQAVKEWAVVYARISGLPSVEALAMAAGWRRDGDTGTSHRPGTIQW